MIGRGGLRALVGALAALTLLPAGASATDAVTHEATFTSGIQNGWARVDRYRDASPGFVAEDYPADGRGDQTGQTGTFFGSGRPHSSRFLLYAAPGADAGGTDTPVLLVHGANQTADQAWANPNASGAFGCGSVTCPTTGLMQDLAGRGKRVFAIGFPHRNGDGYRWAEQIHDAVSVIRARTGASQVDVVGWSKGAFNARQYVSSVRRSWGTAYAGDVRRLVLLGNPSRGFDWGYRHGWSHDVAIFPGCGGSLNAPAPHTAMVCYGSWDVQPQLSYEGSAFPGAGQMLARWDDVYPLSTGEQDWYTTYYGGQGFYTRGAGIQAVIDRDSIVAPILAAGTPASVPVHTLCGSAPTMAGMHNEHTGPSDGAVFLASCSSGQGIATRGASATLALNHLQLGWSTTAAATIAGWLP
ncbi:esterase/lipase family protein [Patulibacter sp. S7RM1-6]